MKLAKISLIVSTALAMVMDTKKVTEDFLKSEIAETKYTQISPRTTHCLITTHTGMEFTGESTVADESNFDEELGKQYAYQQAFESMYEPYGFLLRYVLQNQVNAEDETQGELVVGIANDIDNLTKAKHFANSMGDLVEHLTKDGFIDQRWLSIAKTDLQKAFMSLNRAITGYNSF